MIIFMPMTPLESQKFVSSPNVNVSAQSDPTYEASTSKEPLNRNLMKNSPENDLLMLPFSNTERKFTEIYLINL